MSANERGSSHYKHDGVQDHWDRVWQLYGRGYFVGSATKYLERYHLKNGIDDLRKALHFVEKLIELETADVSNSKYPLAKEPVPDCEPERRDSPSGIPSDLRKGECMLDYVRRKRLEEYVETEQPRMRQIDGGSELGERFLNCTIMDSIVPDEEAFRGILANREAAIYDPLAQYLTAESTVVFSKEPDNSCVHSDNKMDLENGKVMMICRKCGRVLTQALPMETFNTHKE